MAQASRSLTLTPAVIDAMAARVAGVMASEHVPGVVYAVVAGGEIAYCCGCGTVGAPNTPVNPPDAMTIFRIASMTKSFTAAALLLLRDEGHITLDAPIATLVPELAALRLPTTDSPAVTVRSLMTMASGLATDDPWGDRHLDGSRVWFDALMANGGTFAAAPVTVFEYSNYGYAILGRIIDNVTGMPFQDFISSRLLAPLGLTKTGWDPPLDAAVGCRWIDDHWVVEPPQRDGAFGSMGGLWSSIVDLAAWVTFLADAFPARNGTDNGPLCRASRREMQQVWRGFPVTVEHLDNDRMRIGPAGYGMGLDISYDLTRGKMAAHSGGLPGFGSNMRWSVDRGIAVIALGNVTYAPMGRLTRDLFDDLELGGVLPLPKPLHSEVLHERADALVDLLFHWNDESADRMFADNVFLDNERERRRAEAERFQEAVGSITTRTLGAESATSGTMVLTGSGGAARVELQLSPHVPPLVQWYELTFPAPHAGGGEA